MPRARHPPCAVLWDMDGTLVDSAEYHYTAWRATLADTGYALGREEFATTFGQRNDAILRRLLGPGLAAEEIARIGDAKEAHYRRLVEAEGIRALPGAREWLTRLHGSGWRQALASSGPRQNAEVILSALAITAMFEVIVAAEDVAHGKPDPEMFLVAAQRLGVAPRDCIVVEDAPAGLEAGWRAGMRTVAVLTTHSRLEAHLVVRTLADLESDAFDRLLND